jgi:TPR repeat protein
MLGAISILWVSASCKRQSQPSGIAHAKLQLSSNEIQTLKVTARTNAVAAIALSDHYHVTKRDLTNAIVWMRKAAELNDQGAQFNVAMLLLGAGGATNVQEAKKWLEAAAAEGYGPAKRALQSNKHRFDRK